MVHCFAGSLLHTGKDGKAHGFAGNWGGHNATYHHNLIAHCDSRTPRLGPRPSTLELGEQVDIRNNVFYNWGGEGCYGGEAQHVNIVNNYYKPGPGTDETGKAEIDKSFGVSRIELSEKVKDILIKAKDAAEKVIKLVGSDKADGELISGESLSTIAVGEKATLQLGEAGSIHNQGQISAALTVGESGTLAVKTGDFKLADVTAKKVWSTLTPAR